ncbi:hypothetical protein [Tenacibaculum salmonis]|uniref:hypothetical protein n=1 Tax=Tenacibaculum sp. P3-BQ1 TaxID=3232310 RepID=UPI0034DFC9BB
MPENITYQNLERKQVTLIVLLFIGFLPMLLFLYWGGYPLTIYLKANEYKKGLFYLDELDCGTGNGSDDFNCYGYGTINNKKASVNLGKTPGVRTIYKNPNYADLSSDTIKVFYRPNLKQTIVRKKNEEKLDKNKYLRKGLINLIYPILIYPFMFFLYKRITKKLKQLENEQTTL